MEKKQMKEFMTVRLRSLFSTAIDFAFFIFIFFFFWFWISLSSTTHMSAGPKKENNR